MAVKKIRLIRIFAFFTSALFILLACLLAMSFIIRIDDVVEAQGHVESEMVYVVRASSDGYIRQIKVKDGSYVQKGEPLAVVLNQDLENEIKELQINLQQMERKQADTQERFDYLKNISHPSQLESASLKLEKMRISMKGVDAEKQAQQTEANRMEFLAGRELISQRQNEHAQLQARLSEMKEAEQQRSLVELQHDYDTLQKSQNSELQRILHEMAQNKLEIDKVRLQLGIQEEKRSLSVISAPDEGFISLGQEAEKLVGQYIRTGEKLADLISTQSMVFIAAIPEGEVRKLREGQTVNLELNALPYQKFKVFRGQVIQIPSHTEKDKGAGGAVYLAKIKLEDPSVQLDESDQKTTFQVKPGFSGVARIIVRSDLKFINWIKKQIFG